MMLAVVEVVLVERSEGGVMLNEFSAGWCAVPLGGAADGCASGGFGGHAAGPGSAAPGSPGKAARRGGAPSSGWRLGGCLSCAAAPGSPLADGGAAAPLQCGALATRLGAGGTMSVSVFVGSPRWLVLRQALPPGKCPAPMQLLADGAECRLHYRVRGVGGMQGGQGRGQHGAAWALMQESSVLRQRQRCRRLALLGRPSMLTLLPRPPAPTAV